ncbi:MAG TPA: hypothetical protein VGK24_11360 [Candidatus Angelobacter sp.]|jgi:hypothetical protein
MIRISTRIWAVLFAIFVLPIGAFASDAAADAANKAKEKESASTETTVTSRTPAAPVSASTDPLLRLLVNKGVLNASEVNALASAPPAEARQRLLTLLKDKGLLSAADLESLNAAPAPASPAVSEISATYSTVGITAVTQAQSGPPQPPKTPPPSGPIPAIAPIRVLQLDPSRHEGFIPDIKIGKNVNIKPYGQFKASAVYDTSSPYGNDFPLPGFNAMPNTVDAIPEFHIKARFARFGSNFEWLDSPNLVITAKVEADFEGNFGRSNNRNISSIRSNMFQLRLAYARIDWKRTDNTSLFLVTGQDWTPFASSTLPNLFETTGLGVGFGTLYERAPQFRVGMEHNFGAFKLGPEFAVVLPAFGNLPTDLTTAGVVNPNGEGIGNQLGFGERQGADSGKPEIQARVVGQWQLDHAAGVVPAQIIISGVRGERTVDVDAAAVPAAFKAAFPTGAQIGSTRLAWTGEIQLPTRFVTIIAKYYNGNDLRYYFGGQIFGPFNDTTGLTGITGAQSIDGSTAVAFGLRNGVPVIANSLPPRAQGGFVNIGIPLSRLANADPNGRNAGWAFYLHYGYDQVLARDVRREGGGREKGDLGAGTLQYKLNNFVTFVAEESLYRTRALPNAAGNFPLFEGRQMREWKDFRSEFGPIFTF